MTATSSSGPKMMLRSREGLVPIVNWFAFLMNVAERWMRKIKIVVATNGYKYKDLDFWRVLVYREMTRLPMGEAADDLNEELWEQKLKGRGRKRKIPRHLGGKYPRRERLAPNESQVNRFLRELPAWVKRSMPRFIFKAQVDLAKELGILGNTIEVYIDYTNKDYYGKDRFPHNPFITGTHKGAGTNRMRKYCALMLSSGTTRLFAGVFLTRKGESKVPAIGDALAMLVEWGFTIKRVLGDREFSTYDVITTLSKMNLPYIGTMKRTEPVKKVIDAFLMNKCSSVVSFTVNEHLSTLYKDGAIKVHLILKSDRGTRARDVRRALEQGKITLAEARKRIHVFITTETAPLVKKRWGSWGQGIVASFRKRWRIETGFRDCDAFTQTSHARDNETKTLGIVLDMFAYNAWQVERAIHRKRRRVPASWRLGPTRDRFMRKQSKIIVREKNCTGLFVDQEIMSGVAVV